MRNPKPAVVIFAVLSITFVTKLLEAMSPALHAVGNALHVPYTSLMMLLTIPVFISMPVALFVGPIAGNALRYRTLLAAGLLCMGLGGIAPFWVRDWTLILVCRAIFGIGQGIIMPLALALIFSLVENRRQATMMGMQNVIAGLAGMFFSVIAGVLADKSWNYPFLLNGITLVVLVIVMIFLPEPEGRHLPVGAPPPPNSKPLRGLPRELWIYALLTFAYALLVFPSMGNISIVFHDLGLSATLAGTALMFMTGGATVSGFIFGSLFARFGLKTIPIGFGAAALSQVLFAFGTEFYAFAIGELLIGFGALGLAFAGLCMAAGKSVGQEKSAVVMSVTLTGMNAGTFLSPLFFAGMMHVAGTSSMKFPYWVGIFGFALLFVISLFLKPPKAQNSDDVVVAEAMSAAPRSPAQAP